MGPYIFLIIFFVNLHLIQTAIPPLPSYDRQVNALLANMTDEEKVGQMTQVNIDLILKDPQASWDRVEVDPIKLSRIIQDYKVGSILNVPPGGALTLDQWQNIIKQIQYEAQKTRLSIPILYGVDSIHGANFIRNAILFPHATALAATFNTTLVHTIGKIAAHQTRATAIPWSFHPQVDIG